MQTEKKVLILIIIVALVLNYPFIDSFLEKTFVDYETGVVERVIDGDTLVIKGESVRLLGINTPEKGETLSTEAKKFLEEKVLNKTVKLYFGKEKYDLYKRKLAFVFVDSKNVNLEIVRHGFANYYFPSGKDKYYDEFVDAWGKCLGEGINLCEKSDDVCINVDWRHKDDEVILENSCSIPINIDGWSVKDEGRKKFVFSNVVLSSDESVTLTSEDWNKTYVWTKSGDSVFVRDSKNKLVYFDSY